MKMKGLIKYIVNFFILVSIVILLGIDYHYGLLFCNFYDIPIDISLSMMGMGMAMNVALFLFVFEGLLVYLGWRLVKKFWY